MLHYLAKGHKEVPRFKTRRVLHKSFLEGGETHIKGLISWSSPLTWDASPSSMTLIEV